MPVYLFETEGLYESLLKAFKGCCKDSEFRRRIHKHQCEGTCVLRLAVSPVVSCACWRVVLFCCYFALGRSLRMLFPSFTGSLQKYPDGSPYVFESPLQNVSKWVRRLSPPFIYNWGYCITFWGFLQRSPSGPFPPVFLGSL